MVTDKLGMKLSYLLIFTLLLLNSCANESGSGSSGGGLFQSKTISNKFVIDLPADQTFSDGDHIDIGLDHSQIITVTGSPRLVLTIGTETKYAELLTGSGTRTLVFRYTVNSSDEDLDGIAIQNQIDLNGASLTYSYQGKIENAQVAFSDRSSSGLLVQTIIPGPEITNFIEPVNATYADGSEILFQVDFEEDVLVSGTPRLVLNIGGSTKYANYQSGDNSSSLVFSYTVQSGDNDSDGIGLSSSIDLNSGTIKAASDTLSASTNFSSFLSSLSGVIVNTSSGITAPDQITSLSTAPTTSNSTLALSWNVPNNNGTSISHYTVQYREQGVLSWNNLSPSPSTNSAAVSGLTEGVTYEFRVAADNGLLGPWSSTATAEIFSISSLNPIAWLSATDITNGGTEPSDGDKISSWSDLSGVASPATESDPNNQPLYEANVQNGLPAVRFNGLTRSLEGTFTRVNNGGLTVFLVGKMDQNNSRKCFFEFYSTTITRRGFFFNYGFNEASTNYHLDDTGFNVWSAYDDGSKTNLWENGSVVYTNNTNWGNTSFTGSGAYVLGDDQTSGDQINGYIGEFLIFDKQLSAAEILKIETYLKNKWGTP